MNHHTHSTAMPNNRTLYVSDLDGTLLNQDSKVSARTISILNDMIDNHGAMFTVATARTPATVVPLLQEINLTLPAIVMTGAAMWNIHNESYSNVSMMPAQKVAQIYRIFVECGIIPFIYTIEGNLLKVYHTGALNPKEKEFIAERDHSSYKHFILKSEYPTTIESVLVFGINRYDALHRIYTRICNEIDCDAVCYRDIFDNEMGYLEIFEKNTSKATAIQQLAKDINANRIVVFGDNLNDLPMMKIASHSCAVGNAMSEVRAFATETIAPNYQDSVATWIANDITTNFPK